jgi:hypothetical protein
VIFSVILRKLSGRDCREGRVGACRGVGFEPGELCAQGLNEQLSLLGLTHAAASISSLASSAHCT